MSKVKIKTVKDKEISDMFNQMIGAGNLVNMDICYPKYLTLKNVMMSALEVLGAFSRSPLFDSVQYSTEKHEFVSYLDRALKQHGELFYMDFNAELCADFSKIEERDHEQFSEQYAYIKKCTLMNDLIAICDYLAPYKKHFVDAVPATSDAEPKYNIYPIMNAPGPICPFQFSSLDLRAVMNYLDANRASKMKEYIMIFLYKIFTLTYNLYKTYSSPDIDIDRFVEVVMRNIGEVRKQIPRCDKAFKKIIESVNMLKDNFGEYYRDLVETKNSSIIMENFITDVAKNTRADPETTTQFRKIISHYRKLASTRTKDPKVMKIFEKLESQVRELDKFENLRSENTRNDDDSGDGSDEDPYADMTEEERAAALAKQEEEVKLMQVRTANATKSVDELAAEIAGTSGKQTSRKQKK